jgi:hypothetical protein
MAAVATLHCLTGCAVGEVLGMVIGQALQLSDIVTIALAVTLAFMFGYLFSMMPLLRGGLSRKKALRVALAADTVSILSMEITDNLIMVVIPGAMSAGLTSMLFWGSLTFSLVVAFIVTVPVNYWLISRGKGHALAHSYHGHHDMSDHDDHQHHHHH